MDESTLPDHGVIRETLRRFNENLSLVDDPTGDGDATAHVLRWENGRAVRVPMDQGESVETDE